MSLRAAFAAALALLVVSACAPGASRPGPELAQVEQRQCFFASTVTGFREVGPQTVNVRAGAADVYRLELARACPGLGAAEKILLDSRAAGSSVCAGLDVDVLFAAAAGPRRCPGRSLRKLSETDVAALPEGQRP